MGNTILSREKLLLKIEQLELELSDYKRINEGLANAEDINKQISDLRFLNSIAIPLADKSTIEEFSKTILKDIQKHTGAVLATFSFYQTDKKVLVLLHVEAEQDVLKTVLKIAGEKIVNTKSPVDDETYKLIIKDIVGSYNSFTEITFGAIPPIIDKAIRVSTGIDRLFPVAHVIEGELYGTTMLAFKKGQTLPSIELLESYAHLISVSLRRYNAESKLQKSEHRFRFLAENAKDMIYRMSLPEGRYEYVSPASSEIFGYSPQEFYDTPLLIEKAIHPDWVEYFKREWKNLTEGNIPPSYEYQIIHKTGDVRWLNQRNSLIKNEKGNAIAIEGVVTDITNSKQMSEELLKNQKRYKKAQEIGHVGNWEYSLETTNFWGSDEAKRIYGFDSDSNVFTTEKVESCILEREQVHQALIDLIEHDKKYDLVFDIITNDTGIRKTIHSVAELERDSWGNAIKVNGVINDITKQKKAEEDLIKAKEKAEESEKRFKLFVNQSPSPIAVVDKNIEQILYWSESAIQKLGHTPKTVSEWFSVAYPDPSYRKEVIEQWLPMVDKANKSDQVINTGEYEVTCKDGSMITGEFYVRFVSDYLIISLNDVTERKKAKNELIQAKEKAEESDRLKTAFLTNMSHEIRTPMNGILGFTNLLQEPGLTGKQQKNYIEIIQKSGERMLNTVNDIIEISRIETEQLKLTSNQVNVSDHLLTLNNFFRLEAENKGLKLIIDNKLTETESLIKTDKSKFGSIVSNLIKNAIKFTDTGSITIGCKKKGEYLEFCVKDTGIGIPANRIKAIFNRFEQADIEDSRAFQGSGLGLSIAKSYVEKLGGDIWVESKEGVGSQFYFTLPYKAINLEIPEKNAEDSNKPQFLKKGLKVLLAEDDETAITYLTIVLKDYAEEMLIAKTGIEAVEMYRDNPGIDIVLMDIQIPEINGYEATRQIREFNKDVFILAQTAYAQAGDREKAIKAGCNDYISKPINKERLLGIIAKRF